VSKPKPKVAWWIILIIVVLVVILAACCCGLVALFSSGLSLSGSAGEGEPMPTQIALPTPTSAAIAPPSDEEPAESQPTAFPTGSVQPTSVPVQQPALQEARTLLLEWPPIIRAGDSDIIRLTLEVDDLGNIIPTAEMEGHAVTGETIYIPNVYETHNVVAEARLDLAGMQVSPEEMSSQALLPGERAYFFWSVHPDEVGKYRGVVWFFLRFVPLDGGLESERAVAAQDIEIQVVSFLGLQAGPARILGAVGGFLSTVFGIPFLEDGAKWAWKRVRWGK